MAPPNLHQKPPARSQFRYPRRAELTVCEVHSAESIFDEHGQDLGAENTLEFIRRRSTAGSYHRLADSDSLLHVVNLDCEAYGDGTGLNPLAGHVSGAYRAHSINSYNKDRFGRLVDRMGLGAAQVVLGAHDKHGHLIPLKRISRHDAGRGVLGFIAHGTSDPGRRSDPGPDFWWDRFFDATQYFLDVALGTAPIVAPPPPNPGPLRDHLTVGDTGDDVRNLQTVLRGIVPELVVDGDYGPNTKAAVQKFQRSSKLAADGAWGPEEDKAMRNLLAWIAADKPKPPAYPGFLMQVRAGNLMRGTHIHQLQERLHQVWQYPLDVDGVYGDETANMIRHFQSLRGLDVDGIVGPATWNDVFGNTP